ncbi:hypothetical protein V6N13_004214 [Hibiscus sabdariffa]
MKSVSEVCSVETNTTDACLILPFGNSTRHVHATFKKSPTTASEAEAREAVKKNGLLEVVCFLNHTRKACLRYKIASVQSWGRKQATAAKLK